MIKAIFSRQQFTCNEKQIINIPVNLIRPNPYQPRKNFNILALGELCESIKIYGLLQPITVRKVKDNAYELVAGERRLRAVKIIGMKEIPSIIINITDNDSAILALIENSQREDLHFFEEAEAYYNLLSVHKITQEQLSKKIGKSQSTISNKVRLLKLSPIIRKLIIDNNLTERHARAVIKLRDEQMQLKILNLICEKGLNVSKTEELIEKTIDKITNIKEIKNKTIIGAYRDLRIFVNTIKQAVEMMKKSGLKAHALQYDKGEYFEFKIRVIKNKND